MEAVEAAYGQPMESDRHPNRSQLRAQVLWDLHLVYLHLRTTFLSSKAYIQPWFRGHTSPLLWLRVNNNLLFSLKDCINAFTTLARVATPSTTLGTVLDNLGRPTCQKIAFKKRFHGFFFGLWTFSGFGIAYTSPRFLVFV